MSTPQHRVAIRKVALCASALVVAVLATACSAAYADEAGIHSSHSLNANAAASPEDDGDGDGDGDNNADRDNEGDRNDDDDNNNNKNKNKNDNDNDNDNDNKNKNKNDDNKNDDNNKNDDGGLDVLGTDCSNSQLEPHNGFEVGPACVDIAFGEVAEEDKSPSLLITESPDTVKAGEDFTLTVSTRNLVRDRFLGAAAGGYYKESSFLDDDGIQRGHFHTACRMLDSTDEAPEPDPAPEFFLATQDNGGGADPDNVEIPVSGIEKPGTLQCAVWAGDGSHRVPMMQRANQTPAFDVVRITVE
jgi:hypothetical protein